MNNLYFASLCILILYIYSGYQKIFDVNKTAESLHNKFTLFEIPINICVLGIIMVIILEIVGSYVILYSTYTDTYKKEAYNVVLAFIIFNIVVTLIYHNPFEKKEFSNSLKNLSITGGFILLLNQLKQN